MYTNAPVAQTKFEKMPGNLPSSDLPQHLGNLDGMQKKSDDINMATVPSVTYLKTHLKCLHYGKRTL